MVCLFDFKPQPGWGGKGISLHMVDMQNIFSTIVGSRQALIHSVAFMVDSLQHPPQVIYSVHAFPLFCSIVIWPISSITIWLILFLLCLYGYVAAGNSKPMNKPFLFYDACVPMLPAVSRSL